VTSSIKIGNLFLILDSFCSNEFRQSCVLTLEGKLQLFYNETLRRKFNPSSLDDQHFINSSKGIPSEAMQDVATSTLG
jgi:hypothetical protein